MNSDLDKILDVAYTTALDAAIDAGNHILDYWPHPLNPQFKKDLVLQIFEKNQGIGNYATIADTASEEIIINKINHNPSLRSHSILAEESDEVETESPFQWVIDPIDGTLNFRNGLSDFGISIGLLHKYEPVLGIIAMPALKQIVVARKKRGVQLLSFDKKPLYDLIEISYSESINKALISYDTGYEDRSQQIQDIVVKLADNIGYPVSYASASASTYKMAMGNVAAYIHRTPTKYDIAAASVIITEVGGVVTDLEGNTIDWSKPNVSYLGARNAEIHTQLLALLQ